MLDASKAFDRVNFWLLFQKLLSRNVPLFIVRILAMWYTHQKMCIRWGNAISPSFTVSNGVKQGGIILSILFNVYMDGLSVGIFFFFFFVYYKHKHWGTNWIHFP